MSAGHPALFCPYERAEVGEALAAAVAIVLELDPPEDLRAQAFQFAAQALLMRQMRQPNPAALGLPAAMLGRLPGH